MIMLIGRSATRVEQAKTTGTVPVPYVFELYMLSVVAVVGQRQHQNLAILCHDEEFSGTYRTRPRDHDCYEIS